MPNLSRTNMTPKLWQVFLSLDQEIIGEYYVSAIGRDNALAGARTKATLDGHDHLDGRHAWTTRVAAERLLVP